MCIRSLSCQSERMEKKYDKFPYFSFFYSKLKCHVHDVFATPIIHRNLAEVALAGSCLKPCKFNKVWSCYNFTYHSIFSICVWHNIIIYLIRIETEWLIWNFILWSFCFYFDYICSLHARTIDDCRRRQLQQNLMKAKIFFISLSFVLSQHKNDERVLSGAFHILLLWRRYYSIWWNGK